MMDLSCWMTSIAHLLQDRPINSILLPGTHDSGAYQCTADVDLSRFSGELALRWLLKVFPFLVKPWTLTQRLDIAGQLEAGARFLDFRLAVHSSRSQQDADVIYLAHTLACIPLTEALLQVHTWLGSHPGEVVLIRCTPDWPHRHTWQQQHTLSTWRTFQQWCPGDIYCRSRASSVSPTGLPMVTYGEVVSSGHQLLLLFELPVRDDVPRASAAYEQWQLASVATQAVCGCIVSVSITPTDALLGKRTEPLQQHRNTAAKGETSEWEVLLASVWGPGYSAPFWAESDTALGTLQGLLQQIHTAQAKAKRKKPTRYRYAAFAVTPSLPASVSRLLKRGRYGLEGLARELAELLPELLATDLTGVVSSITCDYPTPDVMSAIVNHNLSTATGPTVMNQLH